MRGARCAACSKRRRTRYRWGVFLKRGGEQPMEVEWRETCRCSHFLQRERGLPAILNQRAAMLQTPMQFIAVAVFSAGSRFSFLPCDADGHRGLIGKAARTALPATPVLLRERRGADAFRLACSRSRELRVGCAPETRARLRKPAFEEDAECLHRRF